MTILFPAHPLTSREPDPDYAEEFRAAGACGFNRAFFILERLRAGEPDSSLAMLPASGPPDSRILYRGWMLTDIQQEALYESLVRRGYSPLATPGAYQESHYLPNAYDKFQEFTAKSAWIRGRDREAAWALYQEFRAEDAFIKDFVKSAKHRWKEACFIPAGSNQSEFGAILSAFFGARGDQFNHGIVIRRFHPLTILGTDLRGFPIAEEYRMFFWQGELLTAAPSMPGSDPLEHRTTWEVVARRFQNPFLSIDVAREQSGAWLIIEIGDGGVTGLPMSIEAEDFYRALAECTRRFHS